MYENAVLMAANKSSPDPVFDTLDFRVTGTDKKSMAILKKNRSSCYVTIVHPIMPNFDRYGLFLGHEIIESRYARGKVVFII